MAHTPTSSDAPRPRRRISALLPVTVAVSALVVAGCSGGGGGGKSSAAKTAAVCADWGHVVTLDDSNGSGSSIVFYTQMRDLYRKVEGEGPSSIKSAMKVLVADEQQLADTGSDSTNLSSAADAASYHVDDALTPLCQGK